MFEYNKIIRTLFLLAFIFTYTFLKVNLQQNAHFLKREVLAAFPDAGFDKKSEEEKLIFLLQKTKALQYEDVDQAVKYTEFALQLSRETGQLFYQGQSCFWLSTLQFNKSVYTHNLELLLSNAEIAARIFEDLEEHVWLVHCWALMASILNSQSVQHQEIDEEKKNEAKKYIQKAIIVEDEKKGMDKIVAMLNDFCPNVEILEKCYTGKSAIQAIEEKRPDLVFMDIELGGMHGFDVLSSVQHISFETIFTTAHEEYGIKAIRAGALDYLLKPFSLEELKAAVHKA